MSKLFSLILFPSFRLWVEGGKDIHALSSMHYHQCENNSSGKNLHHSMSQLYVPMMCRHNTTYHARSPSSLHADLAGTRRWDVGRVRALWSTQRLQRVLRCLYNEEFWGIWSRTWATEQDNTIVLLTEYSSVIESCRNSITNQTSQSSSTRRRECECCENITTKCQIKCLVLLTESSNVIECCGNCIKQCQTNQPSSINKISECDWMLWKHYNLMLTNQSSSLVLLT